VAGVVRFVGEVPPPVIVIQGADEQPVLYVDESGALQYAVVYLTERAAPGGGRSVGAPATSTKPAPRAAAGEHLDPVVLDQVEFIFRPQVLAVHAGQLVRFTSQDVAHHNVHSFDPNPANAFNLSTQAGIVPAQHRFSVNPDYRPVAISCDIHPWMAAWVYVFDHPRVAVTDAAGRFEIEAPAGNYLLSVRQPAGGLERDVEVHVAAGGRQAVTVAFTDADLHLPPRQ
jgi:plastocyanin